MFYVVLFAGMAAILAVNLILLSRVRTSGSFEARLRDDLARMQQRQSEECRALREEVAVSIQRFACQTEQRTESLRNAVTNQFAGFLTATTEMQRDQHRQLEAIRGVVDQRLHSLQTDNA